MLLHTFFENHNQLVRESIQVIKMKGIPKITFVGLPDQNIKESEIRIKAALIQSGFNWPKGFHFIVSLKSNLQKNVSRGLEFAVAVAILKLTDQISMEVLDGDTFFGELNLTGEVRLPLGELVYPEQKDCRLFLPPGATSCLVPYFAITDLNDLRIEVPRILVSPIVEKQRPPLGQIEISEGTVELVKILSLSQLHGLFAGPAGSGKTFLTEIIWKLRKKPDFLMRSSWYPILKPHHSSTLEGIIGGGSQGTLQAGEFNSAHHGVMVLDELFEFKPRVLDSLREPMEDGKLRILRSGRVLEQEFNVQVLSTTNLCPCGDYTPGELTRCSFNLNHCRSYSKRFSGPLIDRFHLISFSKAWKKGKRIPIQKILECLNEVWAWEKEEQISLGQDLIRVTPSVEGSGSFLIQTYLDSLKLSTRRLIALKKVATVLAFMEFKKTPDIHHFERAYEYAVLPFEKLKSWD